MNDKTTVIVQHLHHRTFAITLLITIVYIHSPQELIHHIPHSNGHIIRHHFLQLVRTVMMDLHFM